MKLIAEIQITEKQFMEFLDHKVYSKLNMYDVADKALSQVSWHQNMPKRLKLKYIEMLNKHIKAFKENLDMNSVSEHIFAIKSTSGKLIKLCATKETAEKELKKYKNQHSYTDFYIDEEILY